MQVGGQGFRGYKGLRALGLPFQGLGGSGFRAWGLPALTGFRVLGFRVFIKGGRGRGGMSNSLLELRDSGLGLQGGLGFRV